MSWMEINSCELQAVRKLLCMDVSDAARMIGNVSTRTWQYWEAGRTKVPQDVDEKMYALVSQRNQIIEYTTLELLHEEGERVVRWYHTLDSFKSDFPEANEVLWRLHQSICAYFFTENDFALEKEAPLNKNSYLYLWFVGEAPDQLEYKDFERNLKKTLASQAVEK